MVIFFIIINFILVIIKLHLIIDGCKSIARRIVKKKIILSTDIKQKKGQKIGSFNKFLQDLEEEFNIHIHLLLIFLYAIIST